MREVQLYIEGQRVDLFKDETISVTQSIQNVKDIAKVFTDFSKTFTLPASKTNNKIFKHYYNYDIANTFDARIKVAAEIKLNYVTFKKGYIKLEGVNLKDNKPNIYRITFFGEIVNLKDKLGEKKLSDLLGLPNDITYNSSYVVGGLTSNPNTSDTLVPLITHTQRLFYDSNSSEHNSGNLAPSGNKHGVRWDELKPAIRVNRIIEAIETTFPQIEFTDDFFKNTNNPKFYDLYMWVCRKSGKIENLSPSEIETLIIFPNSTSPNGNVESAGGIISTSSWEDIDVWQYDFTYSSGGAYRVEIYDALRNELVYSSPTVASTLYITKPDLNLSSGEQYLYAYVYALNPITFSNIKFYGRHVTNGYSDSLIVNTGSLTTSTEFIFSYAKQMPDITILDFLSGLFKTFNLTAFVQDDGKIKVQPLDDYYNDNPTYRDITEYVGIEEKNVEAALPYREVKFEFNDTKSFLADKYGQINNKLWGQSRYNDNTDNLSGSLYKVEAPFGHFLFERITDVHTQALTTIQWGWSVDKSQNAILPKPLLFYPVRPAVNSSDIDSIMVVTEFDSNNEASTTSIVTPQHVPMNHYARTPAEGDNFQLNFYQENSEWTQQNNFTQTLFSAYSEYISSVFNSKQRLTKLTAYLPLKILLNFNLSDRFIVNGKRYFINNIDTNLQTGESQIELLNDI